ASPNRFYHKNVSSLPHRLGYSKCSSGSARSWHKGAAISSEAHARMIRLDNIGKQNGHQILLIEASAALNKGEKVGLVGPNGAGKTTLFRMITGQEQPDEGQVAVD